MKTKKKPLGVTMLPYMLIAPTLLSICIFSFYPFVKTIVSSFSFTDEYGNWIKWSGTTFWKMLFGSGDIWELLEVTLVFAVMNFVMTVGVSMFLALLCVKKTKLSRIYQTMFALPMAIASATASIVFKFILNGDGGLLNSWLGTNIDWLKNGDTALWTIAVVTTWCHVGHTYLLLMAGFRGVSEDVQEAAIVDGAGSFTRAIKIMIPIASPQIFYVVFLNILSALKTFTQIRLLTAGGPAGKTTTVMYAIYNRILKGEYEYACCLSIIMFLVIFIVTRIQFATENKLVHYE